MYQILLSIVLIVPGYLTASETERYLAASAQREARMNNLYLEVATRIQAVEDGAEHHLDDRRRLPLRQPVPGHRVDQIVLRHLTPHLPRPGRPTRAARRCTGACPCRSTAPAPPVRSRSAAPGSVAPGPGSARAAS